MTTNDPASRNRDATGGDSVRDETETILRGEVTHFGGGVVEVCGSNIHQDGAKLRINGDRHLSHLAVDLTRDDAEALRDELDELIEDE
jgi:hypothetical protein